MKWTMGWSAAAAGSLVALSASALTVECGKNFIDVDLTGIPGLFFLSQEKYWK